MKSTLDMAQHNASLAACKTTLKILVSAQPHKIDQIGPAMLYCSQQQHMCADAT